MVPQGGRRSCAPGWWCPGGEEYNQTPQDSDLNPGLWTRGHRSVPSLSESTAIDERSMRGVCLCVPRWHKTSVVSPEICDTLTPGNSRVALPLFRGVLCHTGREVSVHVATDDQHPMARKMTAMHVCAAACLDSTIRVEEMGGRAPRSRSAVGQVGLDRPTARHTRGGHGRPSRASGSMPCDRQGHRRHASRVSKRFSAIMRSRRARDHPHAGVPCPAPLPRACTATHW